MQNLFDKFTNNSKQAIKTAFNLALALGQTDVNLDHLLYGISCQKGSIGVDVLNKINLNSQRIKTAINDNKKLKKTTKVKPELSTEALETLEQAALIAYRNGHNYIGTEHLLAGLININHETIQKLLTNEKNGDEFESIKRDLARVLNSASKFPDLLGALEAYKSHPENNDQTENYTNTRQPSALDFFATNLTTSQAQKKIDPVIGREAEIERVIQILARRNKNNPLLLGDPGVGKTAIVEGLAKKILNKEVPEVLLNKKIYALDLSSLIAGTSFRGEFENRLKQIINELKKDPNIIIFIDEIHNITGAGAATGSMDAANILKPVLARGEFRCIGATTTEDYKKYIESDVALERRFQPVHIDQPSVEKTIQILNGIKNNYENFHGVKISPDAIKAAAELSEKYITDRFLPDKAIDLIDEAASAIKIKSSADGLLKEIIRLEKRLQTIQEKKQELVEIGNFNLALDYKSQEKDLLSDLEALKESRRQKRKENSQIIGQKEIADIIAKTTGVPANDLLVNDKKRLLNLEKRLDQKIIGQNQAINSVAEFIRRSRTGVSNADRPIGSFLFMGPSGVGKTETAKVLARQIFGSDDCLIRLDMSEFAESFNASKLIGSPAGYVGYKEGAKLTDAVKKKPYSVVLFDEIEKAHPQIFNLLLSILEDGHLTDAVGKKINFKNTIIILTSNIGSEDFNQSASIGFDAKTPNQKAAANQNFAMVEQNVLKKLKNYFRPEFINRLDKIVVFHPLNQNTIKKITINELKELAARLKKVDINVTFSKELINFVTKKASHQEIGARAIRKIIQDEIENKIANQILLNQNKKIIVSIKSDKIFVE
ncbi:MAG: ATP-dependent Clp protease ATP-binding subunit [Candidatus Buchananbacteria bacterium]|nr:ATP-dependent Clp protease ATP-binding subunit [Candidatus Buchananbacteria bacterium]